MLAFFASEITVILKVIDFTENKIYNSVTNCDLDVFSDITTNMLGVWLNSHVRITFKPTTCTSKLSSL